MPDTVTVSIQRLPEWLTCGAGRSKRGLGARHEVRHMPAPRVLPTYQAPRCPLLCLPAVFVVDRMVIAPRLPLR